MHTNNLKEWITIRDNDERLGVQSILTLFSYVQHHSAGIYREKSNYYYRAVRFNIAFLLKTCFMRVIIKTLRHLTA